jgi:hypothetical protein
MEVTMRRPILVATLAMLLVMLGCRHPSSPPAIRESRTFPAAPGKFVKLDLRSLDVQVRVAEANVITVTVGLQARASSSAAARRWVERNTPVIEDSASTLEVTQQRGTRGVFVIGFLHTSGKIELTVPPSCRLEVRTSSGDVTIAGETSLTDPVRVNTASGDVRVTGGVRELIARTTSGDVRVSGPPLAVAEVDTASGDVSIEAGTAKAIVDTSSGDVRVKKLTGDFMADTSSGDVSAGWDRVAPGTKIRIRTASGDVGLRLPASTSLQGEVSTSSGRIHSDFAGSSDHREHHLSLAGPGEGVQIEVRTTSGDASLRTSS